MAQQKEQVLTDQQLIECLVTDSLTDAQIIGRGHLISMQSAEVSRDKVRAENEKFKAEAEHKQRMWKARCEDLKELELKELGERQICRHLTGGRDYKGFFSGTDDAGYGATISKQQLPTGEIRGLCFRCQKPFIHPAWHMAYYPGYGDEQLSGTAAVLKGAKTLSSWLEEEREWTWAMSQKAQTFEIPSGELSGGKMFLVPRLEERMRREKEELTKFLKAIPAQKLLEQGMTPQQVQKLGSAESAMAI